MDIIPRQVDNVKGAGVGKTAKRKRGTDAGFDKRDKRMVRWETTCEFR